jgi:hypothetical protein
VKSVLTAISLEIITGACLWGVAPPKPSPEVKAILGRTGTFDSPNFRAFQALSADERKILLEHFREQYRVATSSEPLSNFDVVREDPALREQIRNRSETALAMLADPELIPGWLQDVKAPAGSYEFERAMRNLSLAARPESIVEIGPLILTDETPSVTYLTDTRSLRSKNLVAAYTILKVIERSPAFSPGTRKWAEDQTKGDLLEVCKILPEWWRDNERQITGKDFQAVMPGKDLYNPMREEFLKKYEESKAMEKETNRQEATVNGDDRTAAKTEPQRGRFGAMAAERYLPYGIIAAIVAFVAGGLWLCSRAMRR